MIDDWKIRSRTTKTENLLNRRRFLHQSGAAILTTALLSSCKGVLDDIFPGKNPKDQTLAFFGDSLTVGAGGTRPYGSVVAEALGNRPVLSDGIVGQIASSIAVRQGGTPLKITIEGNKLNGIQPVKITKLSNAFLSTPINNNDYSRTGSVGGVRCTIRRTFVANQGDTYTITPAAISVISVPADSDFLLEDADRLKTATQILWYGRNDIGNANAETEIISALDKSIAYITSNRYIVLGVLLASKEIKGTSNYTQVTAINTKLATKYGKSFVEMTPPTDEEMTAISYTPSAEDRTDLANLNFPRGLRASASDEIHLNDKGYQIISNRVTKKLKELKY